MELLAHFSNRISHRVHVTTVHRSQKNRNALLLRPPTKRRTTRPRSTRPASSLLFHSFISRPSLPRIVRCWSSHFFTASSEFSFFVTKEKKKHFLLAARARSSQKRTNDEKREREEMMRARDRTIALLSVSASALAFACVYMYISRASFFDASEFGKKV